MRTETNLKVLALGPRKSGKTAFLKRVCHKEFDEYYTRTAAFECCVTRTENYALRMWDISECDIGVRRLYYSDTQLLIITFNPCDKDSLAQATEQLKDFYEQKPSLTGIPVRMVATHLDQKSDAGSGYREPPETVQVSGREQPVPVINVSSKTREYVDKVITELTDEYQKQHSTASSVEQDQEKRTLALSTAQAACQRYLDDRENNESQYIGRLGPWIFFTRRGAFTKEQKVDAAQSFLNFLNCDGFDGNNVQLLFKDESTANALFQGKLYTGVVYPYLRTMGKKRFNLRNQCLLAGDLSFSQARLQCSNETQ